MSEVLRRAGVIVGYVCYYSVPTGLAFLGVLFERWVAWMPSVIILFFVMGAFRAHRGQQVRLMFSGEQIYFLGYLCTIVAFFALAFRLRYGTDPEDLRAAVVLMGCVALSTTIAGLIGMAILREAANEVTGSEGGKEREVHVTVDLPAEFASSLTELRTAAATTTHAIKELGNHARKTGNSASGFSKSLDQVQSGTRSFAEETERGRKALEDYTSQAEKKLRLEKESCEHLTVLGDAYSTAGKTVSELEKLLQTLSASLRRSNGHLNDGNAALAAFAEAAPQIRKALEDFVELLNRKLTQNM